jgi:hypothetical protein
MNDAGANPPAAPVIAPEAPAAVGAPVENSPAARAAPLSFNDTYEKYFGVKPSSTTREDRKTASANYKAESDAFQKILANAMKGNEDTMPSKAEMYFRLAAALGAPTKTKSGFMENVAGAAGAMADYQKSVTEAKRGNQSQNLQLMIKGQELRMKAAHEALEDLKGIDTEEAKNKREFIKSQIELDRKAMESKSPAGLAAEDAGHLRGTEDYKEFVKKYQAQVPDAKQAALQNQLDRTEIERKRLEETINQNKQKEANLTPEEVKVREAELKAIDSRNATLAQLELALAKSPEAYTGSVKDKTTYYLAQKATPDDKKVKATEFLENILNTAALKNLKATFGGQPSNKENEIIRELQGIHASSIQTRNDIIIKAMKDLELGNENSRTSLQRIKDKELQVR